MEEKKEECLRIASECFTTVDQSISAAAAASAATSNNSNHNNEGNEDQTIDVNVPPPVLSTNGATIKTNATSVTVTAHDDSHDEKWLYHYMLGKIAEKRKDHPDVFIGHYIQSAKYLYEHNASYPFRISHSNPQTLSVEALEVYYRITVSIVKYIEQHSTITRAIGRMFIRILKEVNASPFALNQAKIDGNSINAMKRKMTQQAIELAAKKLCTDEVVPLVPLAEQPVVDFVAPAAAVTTGVIEIIDDRPTEEDILPNGGISGAPSTSPAPVDSDGALMRTAAVVDDESAVLAAPIPDHLNSPSRRGSQESNITTTTTTTTTATTGSDSTTSSSSDSSSSSGESSSEDESESDSSEDEAKVSIFWKIIFIFN